MKIKENEIAKFKIEVSNVEIDKNLDLIPKEILKILKNYL